MLFSNRDVGGVPVFSFEPVIHSESDITSGIGLHLDDTDATISSTIENLSTDQRKRVTSRIVFTFPSSMVNKTIKSINLHFVQDGDYQTDLGVLSNNADFRPDPSNTSRMGVPNYIRVLTGSGDKDNFFQFFTIQNETVNLVGSGGSQDTSTTQILPALILKVTDGFCESLTQEFSFHINIALEIDNN
jgi:hypothetical protein